MDLTAIFSLGEAVINRIWPDANKRAEEMRKLEELKQAGDLARLDAHVKLLLGQLEINKTEAQNSNIFVAGWRPFVGWVCGVSLAYVAIVEPLSRFIAQVMFSYPGEFPVIDTEITMQVLLGLLGLAGYRTYEKNKGVAK